MLSLTTALAIQNNKDIDVEPYLSGAKGKYGFILSEEKEGDYHIFLITSAEYSDREEAKMAGTVFMENVRMADLRHYKSDIKKTLSALSVRGLSF